MISFSDGRDTPAAPTASVLDVDDEVADDIIPRRLQNISNPLNALGTMLQNRK
jgi:hypothetical protein